MNVLALLLMRNESHHIRACLENLIGQEVQIHIVDNESTDGSAEIARSFLGEGVVTVETLPYPGHYSLYTLLSRLQEIANQSTADWFIRCDADEILESCARFRTLREGIEAADCQGYNIINFDEFVFLPTAEDESGYENTDFVREMDYYYFFEPRPNRLQRAWKRQDGGIDLIHSGGHAPGFSSPRIYPHSFTLRHYIFLSRQQALSKYAGRIYDVEQRVQQGWHARRMQFSPDKFRLPSRRQLKKLKPGEDWDRSEPRGHHVFLDRTKDRKASRVRWRRPSVAETSEEPAPFIVGAGRSGTTLLRMMLDAHPELAIPPETHVLPQVAAMDETSGDMVDSFLRILTGGPTWNDLGLDSKKIESALRGMTCLNKTEAARTLYRLYAKQFGKARWGDKTPRYSHNMLSIAELLPEAHFIHIIRDGRDVAASGRDLWFGPGDNIEAQAANWIWCIRQARQQAQYLDNYLEVRYEALVREPENTLRKICEFIRLPFDPAILAYHEAAESRLTELVERRDRAGRLVASAERRRGIHARVLSPPDDGRIGRWQTDLATKERAEFEAIAGNMLRDLGYRLTE